jgi:putative oxidoreductase
VTIAERLAHPWLTVRVQIFLGLIFVVAALPKIADPPSFAHMIYNYRLVPGGFLNISALVMPWLELIVGVALIAGVWTRPARWIITGLLLTFIIAISINLARNNAIDCGCFNVADAGKTHEEQIRDMWIVILRDCGMLLMCAQLWWAGKVTESQSLRVSKDVD